MKSIYRDHNFENILNFVEMGRKYFYLWHEKSTNPVKILITFPGINAFNCGDWDYFISKEAKYFGGTQ